MVTISRNFLDIFLGLEVYVSDSPGIGGKIKEEITDFIVREITLDGKICSGKLEIQESKGDYTCFVMEKRGIDTLTAFRIIARFFGISSKRFSAAGLKDAKAITFQLVCVDNISPENLKKFHDTGNKVFIHSIFKLPFKIKPGMLLGNQFEITIRNPIVKQHSELEKRIKDILDEIKVAGGIPNYYGYQRFGTIRPNTHIIGKYIISKKFEEAVKEILTHIYPYESPKVKEARKFLHETWNFKKALDLFPKRLHHERKLIYYLADHPNDYIGALRNLPIQVRRLYIGAYQAYLFNKVISRRLKKGYLFNEVLSGDIVILKYKNNYDYRGRILRVTEGMINKINKLLKDRQAVIAHNVFGYKSIISHGIPGEIELEILEEENVSIDDFKIKHMPEVSSKGNLRPASFYPKDFTYEIFSINDNFRINTKFILGKGIYATVFLRELMKPNNIIEAGF